MARQLTCATHGERERERERERESIFTKSESEKPIKIEEYCVCVAALDHRTNDAKVMMSCV